MAFVNTARIAHGGFGDRIAALVEGVKKALAQRAIFKQTVRELSALNNAELADLGINRSMIVSMAYEAAYGK